MASRSIIVRDISCRIRSVPRSSSPRRRGCRAAFCCRPRPPHHSRRWAERPWPKARRPAKRQGAEETDAYQRGGILVIAQQQKVLESSSSRAGSRSSGKSFRTATRRWRRSMSQHRLLVVRQRSIFAQSAGFDSICRDSAVRGRRGHRHSPGVRCETSRIEGQGLRSRRHQLALFSSRRSRRPPQI